MLDTKFDFHKYDFQVIFIVLSLGDLPHCTIYISHLLLFSFFSSFPCRFDLSPSTISYLLSCLSSFMQKNSSIPWLSPFSWFEIDVEVIIISIVLIHFLLMQTYFIFFIVFYFLFSTCPLFLCPWFHPFSQFHHFDIFITACLAPGTSMSLILCIFLYSPLFSVISFIHFLCYSVFMENCIWGNVLISIQLHLILHTPFSVPLPHWTWILKWRCKKNEI